MHPEACEIALWGGWDAPRSASDGTTKRMKRIEVQKILRSSSSHVFLAQ